MGPIGNWLEITVLCCALAGVLCGCTGEILNRGTGSGKIRGGWTGRGKGRSHQVLELWQLVIVIWSFLQLPQEWVVGTSVITGALSKQSQHTRVVECKSVLGWGQKGSDRQSGDILMLLFGVFWLPNPLANCYAYVGSDDMIHTKNWKGNLEDIILWLPSLCFILTCFLCIVVCNALAFVLNNKKNLEKSSDHCSQSRVK